MRGRWLAFFVLLGLLALGGVYAWSERHALFVWHYARQLGTADATERARLAEVLAAWEPLAWARLVRQLENDDADLCHGSAEVMLTWLKRRSATDPKGEQIAGVLVERWEKLSPPGRGEASRLVRECQAAAPDARAGAWHALVVRLLQHADGQAPEPALPHLLHLAWLATQQLSPESLAPPMRRLAIAGLRSPAPATRVLAVRLASHPPLNAQDQVSALLKGPTLDPAPEVRAMAILSLGTAERALPTDDLLPFLHDADAEVRLLAEQALRTRGLGPLHLQLGKQMLHPDVSRRAQVPSQVLDMPELDANLWLQRLSQDPAPAVRAAMARAVAETGEPALRPWLEKLAESDPSPTVQQLARYYLKTSAH